RAEAAGVDELARRRGETAAPKVLLAADETAVVRLEAGVDERLLHDRVPELDRAAGLGLATVGELLRCERHAPDPVASREPAGENEVVADGVRAVRCEPALRQEPDTAHVHERVHDVRRVEVDTPRDGRHADPVAVVADPGDDAFGDVPGALHAWRKRVGSAVERAEEERVAEGDRLAADRENVPKDSSDPGRGATVRLHGGWVVVGFDTDGVGEPVLEWEDPRVP